MLGRIIRQIVRPATAFAGKIQMGAKVSIALVLVLLPLGLVQNDYVSQLSSQRSQAATQQQGLEYLNPVLGLDREMVQARQVAVNSGQIGNSLGSALSAVDSADAQFGTQLGLSPSWQTVRNTIQNVQVASGTVASVNAAWTGAIQSLEAFIVKIAQNSQLNAQPTSSTADIVDMLTGSLVRYTNYVGQLFDSTSSGSSSAGSSAASQAKDELAVVQQELAGIQSSPATSTVSSQISGTVGQLSVTTSGSLAGVLSNISTLENQASTALNQILTQLGSSLNTNQLRDLIITIVMSILALWLAAGITIQVKDSAKNLTSAMKKVAQGDVTVKAEVDCEDEFGSVAEHLNGALFKIRESLTVINQKMNSVSVSSKDLSEVSSSMSSTADATSERAAAVSSASEQVNTNVTVVAAAIEEMVASVKEIASNASKASEVAVRASEIATIAGENIGRLETSSVEISNVVSLITSIAEQTNLLALNATIEAARAGEMGKGFAVVANEVKDLAAKTTKATEDISHRIEAIQANTQGATESVSQIRQIVDEINDIQGSIASSVEEQAAAVSEVGRSVSEAAGSTAAIVDNITGVAKSAQETSDGADRNQRSAEQVTAVSLELQSLIGNLLGQFEFGNGSKDLASKN